MYNLFVKQITSRSVHTTFNLCTYDFFCNTLWVLYIFDLGLFIKLIFDSHNLTLGAYNFLHDIHNLLTFLSHLLSITIINAIDWFLRDPTSFARHSESRTWKRWRKTVRELEQAPRRYYKI